MSNVRRRPSNARSVTPAIAMTAPELAEALAGDPLNPVIAG
jgi:hypothetical protein